MSIVSVSHLDTTNTGDLVSRPTLYFDYDDQYVDIREQLPEVDAYIFGGGTLFKSAQRANAPGMKIAWGLGQTNHGITKTKGRASADFALFGSRDVGQEGAEWVPCASCMSTLFDKEYSIKHGAVLYMNSGLRTRPDISYLPALGNAALFEEAVRFIGSGSICVTNSYHGAYWATLLNRAAIIIDPYSSKFYNFKHQPSVTESSSWLSAKLVTYPRALEECRAANVAFNDKVKDLLC